MTTEKIDIPKEITKKVLTEQAKVLNVDLDVFEEMYKAQVTKLTEQGVESYDLSGTMVDRNQLAYFSAISAIKTKARSRQNVEGATIIIVGLGGSGKTKDKEQPFRNVYAIADMSIKPEMFLGLKNDGTYVGFQIRGICPAFSGQVGGGGSTQPQVASLFPIIQVMQGLAAFAREI